VIDDEPAGLWVDYADVCAIIRTGFRDPVDHQQLRRTGTGLFVRAAVLRRHAASDTLSTEAQHKLTGLLDDLEEITGNRRIITSTKYPTSTPGSDHHDDHPAAPAPSPRRKRRRKRR